MLATVHEVQALVPPAVFKRGTEVHTQKKLLSVEFEGPEKDSGKAMCTGSNPGERYSLSFKLDPGTEGEGGKPDSHCSCPAAAKALGLCKHMVALLLLRVEKLSEKLEETEAQVGLTANGDAANGGGLSAPAALLADSGASPSAGGREAEAAAPSDRSGPEASEGGQGEDRLQAPPQAQSKSQSGAQSQPQGNFDKEGLSKAVPRGRVLPAWMLAGPAPANETKGRAARWAGAARGAGRGRAAGAGRKRKEPEDDREEGGEEEEEGGERGGEGEEEGEAERGPSTSKRARGRGGRGARRQPVAAPTRRVRRRRAQMEVDSEEEEGVVEDEGDRREEEAIEEGEGSAEDGEGPGEVEEEGLVQQGGGRRRGRGARRGRWEGELDGANAGLVEDGRGRSCRSGPGRGHGRKARRAVEGADEEDPQARARSLRPRRRGQKTAWQEEGEAGAAGAGNVGGKAVGVELTDADLLELAEEHVAQEPEAAANQHGSAERQRTTADQGSEAPEPSKASEQRLDSSSVFSAKRWQTLASQSLADIGDSFLGSLRSGAEVGITEREPEPMREERNLAGKASRGDPIGGSSVLENGALGNRGPFEKAENADVPSGPVPGWSALESPAEESSRFDDLFSMFVSSRPKKTSAHQDWTRPALHPSESRDGPNEREESEAKQGPGSAEELNRKPSADGVAEMPRTISKGQEETPGVAPADAVAYAGPAPMKPKKKMRVADML